MAQFSEPFTTIDTNWTGRPKSIAVLLIESGGTAALIDPGPESTLETLRAALKARGLDFQSLACLLLTHIHLDHAAAAGALVRENPRLKVYVHEFGAKHMADPSRLLASAERLYGGELKRLYGECLPVPMENLETLVGGERVQVGDLTLEVLYTPGHASHHVSYWDPVSRIAFVGDNAGLRVQGNSFFLPATPPPDIDMAIWNQTLDAIASWNPERLFLTHFGYIDSPGEHIRLFRENLRDWAALTERLLESYKDPEAAERQFVDSISCEVRRTLPPYEAEHYLFNGALSLSWRGLARYSRKKAARARPPEPA